MTVLTNEKKDKDTAGSVVYQINKERKGHFMGDCAGDKCPDWITRQVEIVTTALTTVRNEEREAVFKEAVETLNSIEYSRDADNGGYFYSGFLAAKKQLIGALEGKR